MVVSVLEAAIQSNAIEQVENLLQSHAANDLTPGGLNHLGNKPITICLERTGATQKSMTEPELQARTLLRAGRRHIRRANELSRLEHVDDAASDQVAGFCGVGRHMRRGAVRL